MTKFLMHNNTETVLEHKIFDKQTIIGPISGIIDDDTRCGVVISGHEIYCRKGDKHFYMHKSENELIIEDDMLKIYVFLRK